MPPASKRAGTRIPARSPATERAKARREIRAALRAAQAGGLRRDQLPVEPRTLAIPVVEALVVQLGQITTNEATDAVAAALTTASTRGSGGPRVLAELLAAGRRGSAPVLARAMGVTAGRADLPELARLLARPRLGSSRTLLFPALIRLGGPTARKALVAALDDPDLTLVAVNGLRAVGGRTALPRLRRVESRTDDAAVRRAARRAITAIEVASAPMPHSGPEHALEPTSRADLQELAQTAAVADDPVRVTEIDLGAYFARPFRTPSRSLASVGTLLVAASLLGVWRGSSPFWPILGIAAVCYLAAFWLYVTGCGGPRWARQQRLPRPHVEDKHY